MGIEDAAGGCSSHFENHPFEGESLVRFQAWNKIDQFIALSSGDSESDAKGNRTALNEYDPNWHGFMEQIQTVFKRLKLTNVSSQAPSTSGGGGV